MTDITPIPLITGPVRGDDVNRLIVATNNLVASVNSSATEVTQSITNGDTTHAPSGNAVFDALALKLDAASAVTALNGLSDAKTDYATFNMFLGDNAGDDVNLVEAQYNTAAGTGALENLTDGQNNTAIGAFALNSLVDADGNTAVGENAMQATTTGALNTAVGAEALLSNTTGDYNTAIGKNALCLATTADNNTAVGNEALGSATSGDENVAVGSTALGGNTTGIRNTAVGFAANLVNTTGNGNTALGYFALYQNNDDYNVCIGHGAMYAAVTAANNTAIGTGAASLLQTGDDNVFIGFNSQPGTVGMSGSIGIGSGVTVAADNTWVVGTVGKKQAITEGANAAMGVATLVGGTVTVSNTLVTANSRIFLTAQSLGTIVVPAALAISARSAGASFTILSSDVTDTSVVAWEIKEPNA